jgi:imidazolonepropionase-like amidohydrolase
MKGDYSMKPHSRHVLCVMLMTLLPVRTLLAADKTVVLTNVNLVPMTSETVLANQAVIVCGTRIDAIVPSENLTVPAGAQVIDCRQAYLMPGLADMHTHLNDAVFTHPFFNLFLANGVTSIRDLTQGSPPSVLAYQREIEAGRRLGPHIYTTNIYWGWEPNVVEVFKAQQPLGYEAAKLNSYFSREEFAATMAEAKRAHVYTLGHIPYAVGLDGVLAAGMNEVSHVEEVVISEMIGLNHDQEMKSDQWDQQMVIAARSALLPYVGMPVADLRQAVADKVRQVIEKLRGKDITITTTLVCDQDTVDKLLYRERVLSSPRAPYISPTFWKNLNAGKDKHQTMLPQEEWGGFEVFSNLCKILAGEMKQNGVNLVLGTDVGPTYLSLVPGFSVHDELGILVENGFTPYEALLTSTKNASEVAARMTGRNEFGTIEVGKRADLILVESNPLVDLSCARKPLGVMAAGTWLPADTLAALLQVETSKIDDSLDAAYTSGGIEAALGEYQAIKAGNRCNRYYYSSATLNNAAYELLGLGKIDEAIRVFELNLAEYPEDPNSYDSLGEGYMKKGDKTRAIELYRTSLAMNPNNANAADMLKTLGAE